MSKWNHYPESLIGQRRRILEGSDSTQWSFRAMGGTVFKIGLRVKTNDVFYAFDGNKIESDATEVTVSLNRATESELLNAQSASPADAGKIDVLLKILREGEPPDPPIRVEIVNPESIGSADKILAVKRGDDGKLTGAIIGKL